MPRVRDTRRVIEQPGLVEPAATDGEHVVAVHQRIPWLHWPYVIVPLVALVMLLGAAAWAFPGLLARLQLGDYRAAERHIQEFAWPAGLNDDPTLTACGGFATRCARADVGPEAALRATATALADAGLRLGPVRCGPEAETSIWLSVPGLSDCTAEASAGGYSVHAFATEYARTPSPSGALRLGFTQVSVLVLAENPRLAALVEATPVNSAPLPLRVTDVPGLPGSFEALTCTEPEADGCRMFSGTITLADPNAEGLDALATRLSDDLRGGGYLVDFLSCRDVDAGRRCTVGGAAFRSPGGQDRTGVVAVLAPDPSGGVSARVSVSAG